MASPFVEELQRRQTPAQPQPNPFAAELANRQRSQVAPDQQEPAAESPGLTAVARRITEAGLTGGLETAGQFVTGAIAEPIAGLAGISGTLLPGDAGQGARWTEATREALTYEPSTTFGRGISGAVGRRLEPVAQVAEAAGRLTGEAGYRVAGPTGGAIGATIPTAISEVIGLRGTRGIKRDALARAVEESGPDIITPEARQALLNEGFTEAELSEIAAQDPAQLERMARFQRLGVTPTRGDITQTLEAQKPEAQLFESAEAAGGREFRAIRQAQTETLARNINEAIDATGVPADVGSSIKSALESRKKLVRDEARAAYQALAEAQGANDIPILINEIPDMLSPSEVRSIARVQGQNVRALDELLVEFGLKQDADIAGSLSAQGVDIQPLSLQNFEEFRKALAPIERSDQSGNMSRMIAPIRRALDDQVDAMSEALETSSNINIAEMAKRARMNWRAYREEFDPRSLTEQLIAPRPRSSLPQVEASQVYGKVAANATPIEQVDRLMQSLKQQGPLGRRAIADLQSSMMMDLLDSAFKGVTRKVDGNPMISGPAMSRRWDQLENKAKIVFQDNPRSLAMLQDVVQTARDITPQNIAVPKGSAGFLMDAMQNMGLINLAQTVPLGPAMIEGIRDLSIRARNRQALDRAMSARPDLRRTANILATDYPSLATAIGIGYLVSQQEEDNDTTTNQ